MFGPHSELLVAQRGGALVACVHVEYAAPDAWIGMLATHPAEQNTGLGKTMLEAAEALAVDAFGATCWRMSVLSSRPELLQFYLRRGYTLTGEVGEYPVDAGVGTPRVSDLRLLMLRKSATVAA